MKHTHRFCVSLTTGLFGLVVAVTMEVMNVDEFGPSYSAPAFVAASIAGYLVAPLFGKETWRGWLISFCTALAATFAGSLVAAYFCLILIGGWLVPKLALIGPYLVLGTVATCPPVTLAWFVGLVLVHSSALLLRMRVKPVGN